MVLQTMVQYGLCITSLEHFSS